MLSEISGLDRAFFCNSGTEAWEGALKLARAYAQANNKNGAKSKTAHSRHGKLFSWAHLRRAGHHRPAEISSSVRSSRAGRDVRKVQ